MDSLREAQLDQISAYIDGELTPEEAQQVEQWLAEDSQLHQFYRRAQKLKSLAGRSPLPPATDPLLPERVLHSIDRSRLVGNALATTAVLAVAVVGPWLTPAQDFVVETARLPERISLLAAEDFVADLPRGQVLEAAARNYVLTDEAPIDPYTILLDRQGSSVLPTDR